MILPDVNVLLLAHRAELPGHLAIREWFEEEIGSERPFALADVVLSGFLRVATHPRVFDPPTPLEDAVEAAERLRARPNRLPINPGGRHWSIFVRLCRDADARGNLVPDAYLAALAIESGAELATLDRGFARFPGLRWRAPPA